MEKDFSFCIVFWDLILKIGIFCCWRFIPHLDRFLNHFLHTIRIVFTSLWPVVWFVDSILLQVSFFTFTILLPLLVGIFLVFLTFWSFSHSGLNPQNDFQRQHSLVFQLWLQAIFWVSFYSKCQGYSWVLRDHRSFLWHRCFVLSFRNQFQLECFFLIFWFW